MMDLPDDHPGATDPEYRQRRAAIAEVGAAHVAGDPIPDVTYSLEEDAVWARVSYELAEKHRRLACAEYRRGAARVTLPVERVPQLREVDEHVHAITGFHILPVPGLVPSRTFYAALAARTFLSTQYIRHHSVPFYTPEPDIIHEIIGHANMLGSPVFADLYEAAGHASLQATSDEALAFFSRVFWFTLEFGVVWEHNQLRTFGAGLLSSYGEIEHFHDAEIRPWDIREMGTTDYDITRYQPVLFAAPSFEFVVNELTGFFRTFCNGSVAA